MDGVDPTDPLSVDRRLGQFRLDIEEHGGRRGDLNGLTSATEALEQTLELVVPHAYEMDTETRNEHLQSLNKYLRSLRAQVQKLKDSEATIRRMNKEDKAAARRSLKPSGRRRLNAQVKAGEHAVDLRRFERDIRLIEELIPLFEVKHQPL